MIIVYLLTAQGYSAFVQGSEAEAVQVGYISPVLLRTLAQSQGLKVLTLAYSLTSGPIFYTDTGLPLLLISQDLGSIPGSWE